MTIRKNMKPKAGRDWRPSLKQIAEECGLTVATVSRILNGKKNFNPKTVKMVFTVAKKHKYLPNKLLQSMRGGHTRSIGVIVPVLGSLFSEFIHGIHHELAANNYGMMLEWNDASIHTDGGENETVMLHRLIERRVDGIILFPTNENATEPYFREVRERGIPLVVLDIPLSGVDTDFVGTDNFDCGKQAGKMLFESGHRHMFSLIPAGEKEGHPFVERVMGFEDAIRNFNGVKYDKLEYAQKVEGIRDRQVKVSHKMEETVLPILKCPHPCAVFCGNDLIARDLYRLIKKEGRKIPDDISIVGAGNLEFSEFLNPPLTTINQHPFEIGSQAAKLILERIGQTSNAPVTPLRLNIKGTLVPRDSVKNFK